MALKFKVGDRVKVARIMKSLPANPSGVHLGMIGRVMAHCRINANDQLPYAVSFGRTRTYFNARELEAAPAKKRRTKKRGK